MPPVIEMASLFGRLMCIAGFGFVSTLVFAQLTATDTGVPDEALQYSGEDFLSLSFHHGKLCAETLRKAVPGVYGVQEETDIALNVAGVITSRWAQNVRHPNGRDIKRWLFECVSRIAPGREIFVIALVMFEEHGAERRGVELLTRRDYRAIRKLN